MLRIVVSLRHSTRRHPVAVAAAALLSVLIAAPFTAPFSACSLTLLRSATNRNRAEVPTAAAVAVVVSAEGARASNPDASVLTEEQLKNDATPQDAECAEVLASGIVRTSSHTSPSVTTRIIPAVLRV
jgi:hypothetical protein